MPKTSILPADFPSPTALFIRNKYPTSCAECGKWIGGQKGWVTKAPKTYKHEWVGYHPQCRPKKAPLFDQGGFIVKPGQIRGATWKQISATLEHFQVPGRKIIRNRQQANRALLAHYDRNPHLVK